MEGTRGGSGLVVRQHARARRVARYFHFHRPTVRLSLSLCGACPVHAHGLFFPPLRTHEAGVVYDETNG